MSELWLIDAFADAPFSGNPAAVCMLPGHRPDSWHQALAAEMNQAETAFLSRKDGDWGLRWFTPRVEVDLCGHATLASAHFLWESGRLPRTAGRAVSYPERHAERGIGWGLDRARFPPDPARRGAAAGRAGRGAGLQAHLDRAQPLRCPRGAWRAPRRCGSSSPIWPRSRTPMPAASSSPPPGDTRGVDFVSRFFAPRVGVPEDPVTGSAHCALAPFWAGRLGRTVLTGHQASRARRHGAGRDPGRAGPARRKGENGGARRASRGLRSAERKAAGNSHRAYENCSSPCAQHRARDSMRSATRDFSALACSCALRFHGATGSDRQQDRPMQKAVHVADQQLLGQPRHLPAFAHVQPRIDQRLERRKTEVHFQRSTRRQLEQRRRRERVDPHATVGEQHRLRMLDRRASRASRCWRTSPSPGRAARRRAREPAPAPTPPRSGDSRGTRRRTRAAGPARAAWSCW